MRYRLIYLTVIFYLLATGIIRAQEDRELFEPEKFFQELPAPASSQRSPGQMNLTGSQDKISLDVKGMDIVDVIKTLASRSGMNIVVGKNVMGRVNLFLKDVAPWDAFEIIVLANDLAYEKRGEIITVMTQIDYERIYGARFGDRKKVKIVPLKYAKAEDLLRSLEQIKSNIGRIVADAGSNTVVLIDTVEKIKDMEAFIQNTDLPIQTRVFNLSYTPADKLSVKLQEIVTKGVGAVRVDEISNKVIVTDFPAKLEEIAKVIQAFDEKTSQVLIDAQIIELRPSDKFEMGIDWDYWIRKHFKLTSALPIGTTNRLLLGTTNTTVSEKGDYKAILDLLRTIGDTKILSSPRIMVLNNQEARILVGSKEAYITSAISQGGSGTTVSSQSVNFVDVGIKLYVTPKINRDGFITMKIKPEISSADYKSLTAENTTTQVPIVSTSEAETTIMLKDGITVIIGGLRKDERTKTVKKIPLIGDIPGLGFLFRSTSDEVKKTELIILLTPHIMSGEDTFTDFSEVRPVEGAVVKMVRGEIVTEKVSTALEKEYAQDIVANYRSLIAQKVQNLAFLNQPKGEQGTVELSFTIAVDGRILDGPRVISSTNQNLNKAAVDAVRGAAPFPAFPENLDKAQESFRLILEYK